MLDQLGLSAALEWLVDQMRKRENIMIQFEDDGQAKPLDKKMSIILFRSVQELLSDIVKHAKARKAKVSFEKDNNKIKIIVEDDGVGFNAEKRYASKSASKGFGLLSIEERLNHLGGKFIIVSRPNHGTQVCLILPLKEQ